jgi:YfiH family protein
VGAGADVFDFSAATGQAQRRGLEQVLAPLALTWLTLEHGARVITLDGARSATGATTLDADTSAKASPTCDGALITQANAAVAFTTADCLPLVIVSPERRVAAGVHAGWRSLAAGIIEHTLERLLSECDAQPEGLKVWIGPAIAREDYEVGTEVRDALLARPAVTASCFTPVGEGRFLADLPAAAAAILSACGVVAQAIERHPVSTKGSPLLHSVRRDGARAGRMATVVGIRGEVP